MLRVCACFKRNMPRIQNKRTSMHLQFLRKKNILLNCRVVPPPPPLLELVHLSICTESLLAWGLLNYSWVR